jgi:hypothetical protein
VIIGVQLRALDINAVGRRNVQEMPLSRIASSPARCMVVIR